MNLFAIGFTVMLLALISVFIVVMLVSKLERFDEIPWYYNFVVWMSVPLFLLGLMITLSYAMTDS